MTDHFKRLTTFSPLDCLVVILWLYMWPCFFQFLTILFNFDWLFTFNYDRPLTLVPINFVIILNLATWIPCMSWVYQCGNARRVGQPGLIASQGCLCVYCCFPFAMFMWAIKTRYYVKLRLGINVSPMSHQWWVIDLTHIIWFIIKNLF